MKFDKIKKFYDMKLWDINKVAETVRRGYITPEQFEDITGETYG